MHRFYLPSDLCQSEVLHLTGPEAHHAAAVLRARVGEPAVVLDGQGTEYRGRIGDVGRHHVNVLVEHRHVHPPRTGGVHLAVALLKGRAWDSVLEKATELGAVSIQPLAAQRCVARIESSETPVKLAGWRATTIAAAKQCGTPWLPALAAPKTPIAWQASADQWASPGHLILIASLESGSRSIKAAVAEATRCQGRTPTQVQAIIGPEGDFTPEEYQTFRDAGAQPISLGALILRADTAVIAALSIVASEISLP